MCDQEVKRALVLSGGSIKGAFQAGAIAEVLERGFEPDAIYGTSVGSLNGGFLAERAGRASKEGDEIDWCDIGRDLEAFWLEELKSPSQVARKRRLLGLVWRMARQTFNGLTDTRPLHNLVAREFKEDNLRECPIPYYACSVNLATGKTVYASPAYSGILSYIMASTAIPIEMPYELIGMAPYTDGGVREVAPLSAAIDDGATEIVCIVCQPEELQGVAFRPGNLMQFALRLMDVVTNELVNNDLQRFESVNAWVQEYDQVRDEMLDLVPKPKRDRERAIRLLEKLRGNWRKIELTVIRPKNEIVLDLLHFTQKEIAEIIKQGRNVAREKLACKSSCCCGSTGGSGSGSAGGCCEEAAE